MSSPSEPRACGEASFVPRGVPPVTVCAPGMTKIHGVSLSGARVASDAAAQAFACVQQLFRHRAALRAPGTTKVSSAALVRRDVAAEPNRPTPCRQA